MKQTGACTSCLLYKGKVTGHPKANVRRLEAAGRWVQWDRMDINLNGLQKVKSAGHNQYFIIGVSPQKLRIITGVTYLSQILFVLKLLFVEAGWALKEIKVYSATVLMGVIPTQCHTSQGIRIIFIEPYVQSRSGKFERSIRVLKTLARVILADSNLHASSWFYAIQHASVLANTIFLVKVWSTQSKRFWHGKHIMTRRHMRILFFALSDASWILYFNRSTGWLSWIRRRMTLTEALGWGFSHLWVCISEFMSTVWQCSMLTSWLTVRTSYLQEQYYYDSRHLPQQLHCTTGYQDCAESTSRWGGRAE